MKNSILLVLLLGSLNINAESISNRHANPNYKSLKVYAKVIERYNQSDFYKIQIDIINTGKSTVYFWETTSNYGCIFAFSAASVMFVNENERLHIEQNLKAGPEINKPDVKRSIKPKQKYTIITQFFIRKKEKFLKTNKDLRIYFLFNDASLAFMEDNNCPKIISENIIDYKW